ncbi:hypothetical protein HJ01_01090 [Flavobacterium frigoris PS1]|uniref:Uncharacterized protein n=1 Tax=Flavobacterium frigoris (strain PS1) TaxID=1086011 RepID=H7FPJ2_FLAFP|nr:hypothetical protein HJ01_01090 [Flavobacterium frigoris PS1]
MRSHKPCRVVLAERLSINIATTMLCDKKFFVGLRQVGSTESIAFFGDF